MDETTSSSDGRLVPSPTNNPDVSHLVQLDGSSSGSGNLNIKREHDEAEEESGEHASKRQKVTSTNGSSRVDVQNGKSKAPGGNHNGLPQMRRGLDQFLRFVESSSDFSDEAVDHARKLYGLLFEPHETGFKGYKVATPDSSVTQLKKGAGNEEGRDGDEDDVKNPHTAVPPPFALPDKNKFAKGPVPALDTLNKDAPPASTLPPMPPTRNHHTTNLMAAPTSTVLPQAPQITNVALSNAPFVHTSALPAYVAPTGTNSYEPLEFLGDAYLEIIATRLIHSRFPLHTVGQKAGLRELLVKNETLAEYSNAYGFSERIQSAQKDRHGQAWTKIMADVFEAYLACIIIQDETSDAGFLAVEQWLTELWAPKILQWRAAGDGTHDTSKTGTQALDAKTDLNRLLVGKEAKLEYREEKQMQLIKEGNRTIFYMGVYLTGWGFQNQHLGSGEGRSKQIAGTNAAEDALRTSQDIIQLAHQRKVAFERQFKKGGGGGGAGGGNRHKGQGRGRGGFSQHAGVGYPQAGQTYQPPAPGVFPHYPPPPMNYGPPPAAAPPGQGGWYGYSQG